MKVIIPVLYCIGSGLNIPKLEIAAALVLSSDNTEKPWKDVFDIFSTYVQSWIKGGKTGHLSLFKKEFTIKQKNLHYA